MHFDNKGNYFILCHGIWIYLFMKIDDLVQNILISNRITFGGFFEINAVKSHSELIVAITHKN